jgi:hypothetical protein
MTRLSAFPSLLVVLVAALFISDVDAQVATGAPQFGTFSTQGPDVINLGNLNVYLKIPVLNKPQRGANFVYNLAYNSSIWYPVTSGSTESWTPVSQLGWQGLQVTGPSQITYSVSVETPNGSCTQASPTWTQWRYDGFVYSDPTGAQHSFNATSGYNQAPTGSGTRCPTGPFPASTVTASATDGSGYSITVTPLAGSVTATLTDGNNNIIAAPVMTNPPASQGSQTVTDSNGNQVTSSGGVYTDTTGVTALTIRYATSISTTLTYNTTGSSPGTASYDATYAGYTVQTAFGCAGIGEYGPTATSLVNRVTLPDGSFYAFTYEPTPGNSGSVTGRIASITLPAGGTINYAYSGGSNGIECNDGSTAGLTRTIAATAGSPASVWFGPTLGRLALLAQAR